MFKKLMIVFLMTLLATSSGLFSQVNQAIQSQEIESSIPELAAFHDVIYPIWHTAYPEKDYALLRKYAPEVKSHAEKIYGAKLPGILRDKETRWQEGLDQFRKSVDDYQAAVAGTNDEALLNAGEALHAKYEALNRIINPVLKEMDEFHRLFYVVYHKLLPDKNYAQIKAVSGDMKAKAEGVTKAALPKRLEAKSEPFKAAAAELNLAASELDAICRAGHNASIEEAINKLHVKYQNLEKLFS